MDNIKANLEVIQANIARAAEKSGRRASDITLVGVTKTIDTARIQHLVDLGVFHLGENKVQELVEKIPAVYGNPVWHLIGHLQTNKVKYIIGKAAMIHSVDSLRLAKEIDKRAGNVGKIMDILMEVNVAGEETKDGVSENEAHSLAQSLLELPNVRLKGLMTIAPFVENSEENRPFFQKLYQMFIDISNKYDHNKNMEHLSMGMTNDYETAIEEGATIVRIGTGIFGPRLYL